MEFRLKNLWLLLISGANQKSQMNINFLFLGSHIVNILFLGVRMTTKEQKNGGHCVNGVGSFLPSISDS